MPDKTFSLPPKEEMLQRLLKVSDNPYTKDKFYPLLTKHGGEQKTAMGVVLMLELAIRDYTQGMAVTVKLLGMHIPHFIDALCPAEEFAKEVKAIYKQAMMV